VRRLKNNRAAGATRNAKNNRIAGINVARTSSSAILSGKKIIAQQELRATFKNEFYKHE